MVFSGKKAQQVDLPVVIADHDIVGHRAIGVLDRWLDLLLGCLSHRRDAGQGLGHLFVALGHRLPGRRHGHVQRFDLDHAGHHPAVDQADVQVVARLGKGEAKVLELAFFPAHEARVGRPAGTSGSMTAGLAIRGLGTAG